MAVNNQNLAYGGPPNQGGRIRIMLAPRVAAGGAVAFFEIGHTDDAEFMASIETISFESDQSKGDIEQAIVKQALGFMFQAMESRLDLWRIGLAQPAANQVGNTLFIGDAVEDRWTIKADVKGPVGAGTPNRVLTLWNNAIKTFDAVKFGKRVLQKLKLAFNTLRDDSIVANAGVYGQVADAA